jgi:hypothetical protein
MLDDDRYIFLQFSSIARIEGAGEPLDFAPWRSRDFLFQFVLLERSDPKAMTTDLVGWRIGQKKEDREGLSS